jgi:hypothetical protein
MEQSLLEQDVGIEPTTSAWKAVVLPIKLNLL